MEERGDGRLRQSLGAHSLPALCDVAMCSLKTGKQIWPIPNDETSTVPRSLRSYGLFRDPLKARTDVLVHSRCVRTGGPIAQTEAPQKSTFWAAPWRR
jgi:hypothetical protein